MKDWTVDQQQKKFLFTAIIASAIGMGFHAYLTSSYYNINFALSASESLCNINSIFNCDAVSTSKYAALWGIPMALWGAVIQGSLLILLLTRLLNFSDSDAELGRFTFYFSGFIFLVSLVMGSISISFLGVYCLFCMATYLTSFIQFAAIIKISPDKTFPNFKQLLGPLKWIPIVSVALPIAAATLTHNMILDSAGIRDYREAIDEAFSNWKVAKTYSFDTKAGLTSGPESAKMTIVEFADFLCPHCKVASKPIKDFIKTHPKVRLIFKTFPLDGCRGSGIQCNLARTVYCANKQQKGWEAHDWIFENQAQWHGMGLTTGIEKMSKKHGLDKAKLMACLDAEDTKTAVNAIRKEGEAAKIGGTPTLYINGRKIQTHSQFYKMVLTKIYEDL